MRWDLDHPDNTVEELKTTGDTAILAGFYPGFVWHPSGYFVAWDGGQTVYLLNPSTLVWTTLTGSGANPGPAQVNGTYGRFRYIPSKDVFIALNSVDDNVYFYRLPAEYAAAEKGPVIPHSPGLNISPNPCRDKAALTLTESRSKTTLEIFDIEGRLVECQLLAAGRSTATWTTPRFPAGLYTVRARQQEGTFTKRLMVVK